MEAASTLKKLDNVKRRAYNKAAVTDIFAVGRERLMKDTKKQRQRAICKRARRLELVYLAVDYFQERMSKRRRILTDQIEKVKIIPSLSANFVGD